MKLITKQILSCNQSRSLRPLMQKADLDTSRAVVTLSSQGDRRLTLERVSIWVIRVLSLHNFNH
jgi:hypothetical protein